MDGSSAGWRKATYSGANGGNCVEVGQSQGNDWRKSTFSSNGGAACVETATGHGVILVRDTQDRQGFMLEVPADAWAKFITRLAAG